MAVDPRESRNFVINEVEHGEQEPLLDNTDSLFKDKEVKKKLKLIDYVKITLITFTIINQGTGYALISSFFPVQAVKRKGLTISDVGIIMSTLPFTSIISGIFLSYLLPRLGSRKLLLLSLFLEAVSLLPFAFVMKIPAGAGFYAACMLCRFVQGFGYVANQISTFSFITGEYNDRMSTIMGIFEMAIGVGMAIGPAIGGILYGAFGFGGPLYFLFGASTVLLVLCYFFVYSEYSFAVQNIDSSDSEVTEETTPSNALNLNRKTIFKVPGVFLLLAASLIVFTNATYFDVSLSPFLSKTFNMAPAMIGLVYFSGVGMYAIAAPLFGVLIDRKGHKGLTIILGCFIVVPGFLLLGPVPFLHIPHNAWLTAGSLMLLFIGTAAMFVPIMGICFDVVLDNNFEDSEHTRAFLTSIFVFVGNVGNFLGPFLGGFIVNDFGFEWAGLFFSVATAVYGSILILYLLKKSHNKNKHRLEVTS